MTNHVQNTEPQALNRSARDAEKPENHTSDLTLDEVFSLLSVTRRREAIEYLAQQDAPVDLPEIVDHVTTVEFDKSLEDVTSNERRSVYSSLQQKHLPKLQKFGIVSYRSASAEITLDDNADIVLEYLHRAVGASPLMHLRTAVKGFLSPSEAVI